MGGADAAETLPLKGRTNVDTHTLIYICLSLSIGAVVDPRHRLSPRFLCRRHLNWFEKKCVEGRIAPLSLKLGMEAVHIIPVMVGRKCHFAVNAQAVLTKAYHAVPKHDGMEWSRS